MQKYSDNFINSNGRPVAGALVTVTTFPGGIPATLYSDNGLTPIASNVVLTDSLGAFAFYAADGRYTITITSQETEPVVRQDVLLEDPEDGSSVGLIASNVSYTQPGSNFETNVAAVLQEIDSVSRHGAVGDGVTDCSAAFLAVSGKMATIPAGEFAVYGNVALSLDTKLRGAGRNTTIVHVYGEMSWNSTTNFQTGGFSEITWVYHGAGKARVIGVNMEFDGFTQNCFLAHDFSVRPASGTDRAQVFFDVVDPRQAIFRDFYADMNFNSTIDPSGQVQERLIKTSGTGFGLIVDNYFVRDVYSMVYQTGAVEGGHIGKGEIVGCYIGVDSDAAVPGGWIGQMHVNAVHRGVRANGRSYFWIDGLSAFRSPVFYQTDWAPIEVSNGSIGNIQNVQAACNPGGHGSRASGVIANNMSGLTISNLQTVEVGKNGGALLELVGSTRVDARQCLGVACNLAVSADAACSNSSIDVIAFTGTGTVSNASGTVFIKGASPERAIAPAGTVSAPGMAFAGETDCGLYIPGANQVSVASAGSEIARFLSGGSSTRIEFVSGGPGVAPRVRAAGEANADLELAVAGTGSLKSSYSSVAATTPGNFSAARSLRFKDGSGTVYYIPLAAAPW